MNKQAKQAVIFGIAVFFASMFMGYFNGWCSEACYTRCATVGHECTICSIGLLGSVILWIYLMYLFGFSLYYALKHESKESLRK